MPKTPAPDAGGKYLGGNANPNHLPAITTGLAMPFIA
jgi:hypothetical protein